MTVVFLILLLVGLIYAALIMPRVTDQPDMKGLLTDYAHRGLFDNKKVPENSLAAFRYAADRGYGIELDVQMTSDGEVVVFHDYTLDRMCGEKGKLSARTLEELRQLRLLGTSEYVPTLKEVLELVGGRVPILVELKGESANDDLCRATARLLDEYDGPFLVESFNPLLLRWFKTHRPEVARGQLVTNAMKKRKGGNPFVNFLLTGLLLNFLSRPDFIACDIHHMGGPSFYLCAKVFRVKRVYWTVRSREDFNAIREAESWSIFEGFIPQ